MEDDVFGVSVWVTSTWTTPATIVPEPEPSSSSSAPITVPVEDNDLNIPPPLSTNPSSDSQIDDFDDFGTAAESLTEDDIEDFGDFGDFGKTDALPSGDFSLTDVGFGEEVRIHDIPPILGPVKPLELDPMPDRDELVKQVTEIMGPICGEDDMTIMTEEPLREREGLDQILVTPESREVYGTLFPSATPPMQLVNWTRSRTRRQHLISLGIPINLDQVLPRTLEKLPAMQITTRSHSVPPRPRSGVSSSKPGSVSNTSSQAGSRPTSPPPLTDSIPSVAAQLRLGVKPELDELVVDGLVNLTPETMNLSSLSTLQSHRANLQLQTANASALLAYLLQTRDALQQDSETYNQLIGELVGEAQKIKTAASKVWAQTKRGST